MRKALVLLSLVSFFSCDQKPDAKVSDGEKAPDVAYLVINARTDKGSLFYDIYIKDTSSIKTLNDYLKEKYNKDRGSWIEINYFNDSVVAKSYFDKQLDNNLSEKTKDKLFKAFIANYKYNPNTKYDSLVFEH